MAVKTNNRRDADSIDAEIRRKRELELKRYEEEEKEYEEREKEEIITGPTKEELDIELAASAIEDEDEASGELEGFEDYTAGREVNLSNPVAMYIHDIAKYPQIPASEQVELARKAQAGDGEARERLITCNLRWVFKIAKRCAGSQKFEILDLIQEGNRGIMTAIDKFDPDSGYAFTTYATWWIKQHIYRYMGNEGRIIRLPVHVYEGIRVMSGIKGRLTAELGREPTENELKEEGCKVYTASKVDNLIRIMRQTISSLETPVNAKDGDGDTMLGDLVGDRTDESPQEYTERQELVEAINRVLGDFKPRDRRIMELRYGLNGEEPHILTDIAEIIYKEKLSKTLLTRERVRQIEAAVIERLARNKKLIAYV